MGKAHKAPDAAYTQKFAVMDHAVQRFRERAERFLEQGGFLDEAAVRLQLDYQTAEGINEGRR